MKLTTGYKYTGVQGSLCPRATTNQGGRCIRHDACFPFRRPHHGKKGEDISLPSNMYNHSLDSVFSHSGTIRVSPGWVHTGLSGSSVDWPSGVKRDLISDTETSMFIQFSVSSGSLRLPATLVVHMLLYLGSSVFLRMLWWTIISLSQTGG